MQYSLGDTFNPYLSPNNVHCFYNFDDEEEKEVFEYKVFYLTSAHDFDENLDAFEIVVEAFDAEEAYDIVKAMHDVTEICNVE